MKPNSMQNLPSKSGRNRPLSLSRGVVSNSMPARLQLTQLWKPSKHTNKAEGQQDGLRAKPELHQNTALFRYQPAQSLGAGLCNTVQKHSLSYYEKNSSHFILTGKKNQFWKTLQSRPNFFPLPLCWYCDRYTINCLADLGQGWGRSMCSHGGGRWPVNMMLWGFQHHLSYKICIKWKLRLPCTYTNTNIQDWVFEKNILFGSPNVQN